MFFLFKKSESDKLAYHTGEAADRIGDSTGTAQNHCGKGMKIAVIGYSGSGKSTLAHKLGELYGLPVLHLDSVHFLPDWQERSPEDEQRIVNDFLAGHDAWVIDGNYSKLSFERRMKEADMIIMMLFRRLDCLWRVSKRFRRYQNTTRPDMAEGCSEKLDREFVAWILWEGRKKTDRKRFDDLKKKYPEKVVVLKNQRQLDEFQGNLKE